MGLKFRETVAVTFENRKKHNYSELRADILNVSEICVSCPTLMLKCMLE
jgi:hypothetical protein